MIRGAGYLCGAVLSLVLLFPSLQAVGADRAGDEFLTGYVAAILERDLHWERDSYLLKIHNGVAVITLFNDDPIRRESVDRQLRSIEELQRIAIEVKSADAGRSGAVTRVTGLTGQGEVFPTGDQFQPLIADPKQA